MFLIEFYKFKKDLFPLLASMLRNDYIRLEDEYIDKLTNNFFEKIRKIL